MSSLILLNGCIADPELTSAKAREELRKTFREQSERDTAIRLAREHASVRQFVLSGRGDPNAMRLSVDLDNASLSGVIDRVTHSNSVQYRAGPLPISGRVSARFSDMPLLQALNVLLSDTGFIASADDGVLTFTDEGWRGPSLSDSSETVVLSRELPLEYLQADDAVSMLRDLFEPSDSDDGNQVAVGSLSELNAIYITGPEASVEQAVKIVERADRPVPHVIISALVVNVNSSSVESLGLSFSDLSDGSFSISSIVPNTTGGNVVATFEELAGNSAQLTATLNFLAAQNVLQVLSRPYVATRSTKPATIEIVDDQFVRVDTTNDDSSIIGTDSITAGISMTITPIVMAGDGIRLDVSIEDSRFGATAANVLIAKERNSASTSMVVESGQTIVIGGLNSKYRITEKSGMPWLRKIPLINLFTAEQSALETQNELVVYLTPYIWIPGMKKPRLIVEDLRLEHPELLSVEKFGLR